MKLVICAGPPTSGKTTVLRQAVKRLIASGIRPAYLKIDVQSADEDVIFSEEFGLPAGKVYSGELCPDHCNAMVLRDAVEWASGKNADLLLVETAGLCLRCSPYVTGALAVAVLEATSGMNLPRKIGPMLGLADIAVVTKIDLVSQAEREVFRAHICSGSPGVSICETNALCGIGIDQLVKRIVSCPGIQLPLFLRGNPPVGTCTVCAGKKEVGWQNHFGVVRPISSEIYYRGE